MECLLDEGVGVGEVQGPESGSWGACANEDGGVGSTNCDGMCRESGGASSIAELANGD